MNNLEKETKQIMHKYNIYANKSLGQNFLINEEIVISIIEEAEVSSEDAVIEIGPGIRNTHKIFIRKSRKSNCNRTRQQNDKHTKRKV